ncbi:hypothetical protein evm_002547 [Chilo suppressalis]|nr:hypothetical protein evm_002547 [Chilo suppressalis]
MVFPWSGLQCHPCGNGGSRVLAGCTLLTMIFRTCKLFELEKKKEEEKSFIYQELHIDTTVVAASTSTAVSTAADFNNQLKIDLEVSPITRNIRSGRGLHKSNEELQLKNTIKKLKVKLAKAKKSRISFKQRLALVRKQCHTDVFNVLSKKMSESAKIFLKMQLLQSTKKHKGRRYTLTEKILALSVYKPSPKAYRFLSGICALPSPKTLQKLLHKLSISAGLNEILFHNLKQRVAKMPNSHRFCSLIFDEMAISTGLSYDKSDDKIFVFVDNGTERKTLFADHVLVFMVRGVIKKYKQPIMYTFCSATTKTTELKNLIKEVITKVQQCGLEIVATICDQGASNKAAINSLINDSRAECLRNNKEHRSHCFAINQKTIISIYDPPHLLKEVDGVQLVPKLTAHHVIPNLIPKMKVKHCTQVFSSSVGIAMSFMTDSGKLPMEYKDTARL